MFSNIIFPCNLLPYENHQFNMQTFSPLACQFLLRQLRQLLFKITVIFSNVKNIYSDKLNSIPLIFKTLMLSELSKINFVLKVY